MISNSTLRDNITKLFEVGLARLIGYKLNLDMDYKNKFIDPLLNKYFIQDWPNTSRPVDMIPEDDDKVMNDKVFYTVLVAMIYERQRRNQAYVETIEKAPETDRSINLDINKIAKCSFKVFSLPSAIRFIRRSVKAEIAVPLYFIYLSFIHGKILQRRSQNICL